MKRKRDSHDTKQDLVMALIKSAGLLGISERNRAVLVKLDDQQASSPGGVGRFTERQQQQA